MDDGYCKFTESDIGAMFVGSPSFNLSRHTFFKLVGFTNAGNPKLSVVVCETKLIGSSPIWHKDLVIPTTETTGAPFIARRSKAHGVSYISALSMLIFERYNPEETYYNEWHDRYFSFFIEGAIISPPLFCCRGVKVAIMGPLLRCF